MKRTIYLQKLGELDRNILEKLKKRLKRRLKDFVDAVEISLEEFILSDSDYESYRKQCDASSILNKLATFNISENRFRTLGIIDKDIFTGSYRFVFGVAKTPLKSVSKYSGVAIISLTRLREEFYDRPENIDLFELRTLKEAIHEIGHTFGLDHCNNYCIMKFSKHLGDTDNKPPEFCERCLKELKNFLKETF